MINIPLAGEFGHPSTPRQQALQAALAGAACSDGRTPLLALWA